MESATRTYVRVRTRVRKERRGKKREENRARVHSHPHVAHPHCVRAHARQQRVVHPYQRVAVVVVAEHHSPIRVEADSSHSLGQSWIVSDFSKGPPFHEREREIEIGEDNDYWSTKFGVPRDSSSDGVLSRRGENSRLYKGERFYHSHRNSVSTIV